MAGMKLKGLDKMEAKIERIARNIPNEAARVLYLRCEHVMTRSKQEFVPVAEVRGGTLRASGHVWPPEIHGRKITCTMSYGGPADAYAVAIHEHLSQYSPPSWQKAMTEGDGVQFHPEGRGPKYLEIPLMEEAGTAAEDLAHDFNLQNTVK